MWCRDRDTEPHSQAMLAEASQSLFKQLCIINVIVRWMMFLLSSPEDMSS